MDVFVLGVVATIVVVPVLAAALVLAVRAFRTSQGTRLVRCPETSGIAEVRVNPWWASLTGALGDEKLAVQTCTHWPERGDRCSRDCLHQIESSPTGCRKDELVAQWRNGRPCAVCGSELESVRRAIDRVAYVGPDGTSSPLTDLAGEDLVRLFWSCKPICWHCHTSGATGRVPIKSELLC